MFEYSEDELPEVTVGSTYDAENPHFVGDTVTYYNVGNWSMSSLPDEDANIEYARNAALAWIAWYEFLKNNDE